MDSIGYLTSVAPRLTSRAHKQIPLAPISLKLKKATEPHTHCHEQQEIRRLINKLSLFPSSCFLLQFSFVLNRHLFRYYNTELFQVFTVFYIPFLEIQEWYLRPHQKGRKVNIKHLPQPVQHPTGSLSQSQGLSPRLLFPSLMLPHPSAFKEPVCLLFSHTPPCWKLLYTLPIWCSAREPGKVLILGFQNSHHLQLQSGIFERLQSQATKPGSQRVARAKFKSGLKVLWFYFHFSSYHRDHNRLKDRSVTLRATGLTKATPPRKGMQFPFLRGASWQGNILNRKKSEAPSSAGVSTS